MSNMTPSSSKSHSKKTCSSRDKNKTLPSESGGSTQCDTPPLIEKDGSSSQGKYAGIGADSVLCMSEQVGAEITPEAAANLAEDVSYKLRQMLSNIALHSEMMKKTRLDDWDVNTALVLSDTSPVVGACAAQYTTFSEEKLCYPIEDILNVMEIALTPQSYIYTSMPTISVEWITDEKSLNNSSNISLSLQNYYTKVAKAILNLRKKCKEVAVQDLTTNTRIGPIFPNLFNLAVLVLNDDNLNALNVPAKKPLQSNVLDMVDALCSNPCSLDTNIQQQFQRLFPVMVSNILGNGSLAEKMVSILTKITRTWPSFIAIGKGILFDYLSQGTKERLTAPMLHCVLALGRQALVECLGDFLDHLDDCIHAPRRNHAQNDLRETMLDVATSLLRSEPTTYLEDFVTTDYTLYEMLGDSIIPRRLIFPYCDPENSENAKPERTVDEEFSYNALRYAPRRQKLRCFTSDRVLTPVHRDSVFEATYFSIEKRKTRIRFRIKGCRNKEIPARLLQPPPYRAGAGGSAALAGGLLRRFRFRLRAPAPPAPLLGALTL